MHRGIGLKCCRGTSAWGVSEAQEPDETAARVGGTGLETRTLVWVTPFAFGVDCRLKSGTQGSPDSYPNHTVPDLAFG